MMERLRNYKIDFSPAYPPYRKEDRWELIRKVKCGLNCGLVLMTGTYEECEKKLNEILKGQIQWTDLWKGAK